MREFRLGSRTGARRAGHDHRLGFRVGRVAASRVAGGPGLSFCRNTDEFHAAEMQCLSRPKKSFLDRLPIDERSVGGTEIADENAFIFDNDFAMTTGNGRMIEHEIIVGRATNAINTRFEGELPWNE